MCPKVVDIKTRRTQGLGGPMLRGQNKLSTQKEDGHDHRMVRFLIHAPDATEVYLAGNFNNWDCHSLGLKRRERGFWITEIKLSPGSYKYKFNINGKLINRISGAVQVEKIWVQDIAAAKLIPNPFGSADCFLMVK